MERLHTAKAGTSQRKVYLAGSRNTMGVLAFTNGIGFNIFSATYIFYTTGNRADKKEHHNFYSYTFRIRGFRIFIAGFWISTLIY